MKPAAIIIALLLLVHVDALNICCPVKPPCRRSFFFQFIPRAHSSVDVWNRFENDQHDVLVKNYWQKRPLLIKNAFPNFRSPLSPDDIAALSCDFDVESRIISGETVKNSEWTLRHGPFDENFFEENQVNTDKWTLLVNEVNRYSRKISNLLSNFSFVPNWIVDDVMVSYAVCGGSVGPHIDNYDVFLLQGAGKREWAIENFETSPSDESERLVDNIDVRILKDFSPTHSWVLNPGDMLYLPPRFAHHGVSLDNDCITFSIGFRAPSYKELLVNYFEHTVESIRSQPFDQLRINQSCTELQSCRGLIDSDSIEKARTIIKDMLMNEIHNSRSFSNWFGSFATQSRRDHTDYPLRIEPGEVSKRYNNPRELLLAIVDVYDCEPSAEDPSLYRREALTFAYVKHQEHEEHTLFVDGEKIVSDTEIRPIIPVLCNHSQYSPAVIGPFLSSTSSEKYLEFLEELLLKGVIYYDDDDYV